MAVAVVCFFIGVCIGVRSSVFFSFLVMNRLSIVGDDLTAVGTSRRLRVYIIDNAPDMENMKWVGREMESIRGGREVNS